MADWHWVGTIAILAVIVALCLVTMIARVEYGFYSPSHITVINRSDEPVSDARLKHGERELVVGAIGPGQSQSADFIISHEGSLALLVKFSSGQSVSADGFGYVTPGMPVTVIANLTEGRALLVTVMNVNERPLR